MSLTVFKYPLPFILDVPSTHQMPLGAHILTAWMQATPSGMAVCLWAAVDPTAPLESRSFLIVPTGKEDERIDPARYIGTVHDSFFVWHIFETT